MDKTIILIVNQLNVTEADITAACVQIREAVAGGSSVDGTDAAYFTALQYVVTSRHCAPVVVSTLLELGADPNHQTSFGTTALHCALRASAGLEIVRMLVDAGAYTDIEDNDGVTPHSVVAEGSELDDLLCKGCSFLPPK
eukprot:m.184561 g.184561  ORF g.184561 m.184561 type:complete len:140 (-) comp18101_c1_seq1:99-518(-)